MRNYLLLAAAVVLTACTGEESKETQNLSDETSLSRTESFTYLPEDGSVLVKNVQYFKDGTIIAENTFDASGEMVQRVEHVKNRNIYTQTYYSTSDDGAKVISTVTSKYDDEGRLIEKERTGLLGNYITTITYNNGIINTVQIDNDRGRHMESAQYTINAEGVIESVTYTLGHDEFKYTSAVEFENGKPVQCAVDYGNDGTDVYTFSYYSNPVPANRLKSVTQINNNLIENGGFFNGGGVALSGISYFNNYYLKNLQMGNDYYEHHVKKFNAAGYLISNHVDMRRGLSTNTFYYYE